MLNKANTVLFNTVELVWLVEVIKIASGAMNPDQWQFWGGMRVNVNSFLQRI